MIPSALVTFLSAISSAVIINEKFAEHMNVFVLSGSSATVGLGALALGHIIKSVPLLHGSSNGQFIS